MPHSFLSIPNIVAIWMTPTQTISTFNMCKAASVAFIFREIWNSRCRTLFQGEKMNARRIAMQVLGHVRMTTFIHLPPKPNSRIQDHFLGIVGIPPRRPKIKHGFWCRWNNSGGYKLNFDRPAKDNLKSHL